MTRRTIAVAVALAATVATAVAVPDIRARMACRHEDSAMCVWWGPLQGNRDGAVVFNGPTPGAQLDPADIRIERRTVVDSTGRTYTQTCALIPAHGATRAVESCETPRPN